MRTRPKGARIGAGPRLGREWEWEGELGSAALARFVYLAVDASDLAEPDVALVVLHVEQVVERPVKVIRDVGYLLVKLLQGVASYPPWPTTRPSPPPSKSMSNSC